MEKSKLNPNLQFQQIQDNQNLNLHEKEIFMQDIFRTEELTKGEYRVEKVWNEN